MNKIKGIIFDMGSTLLEFENSNWKVLGERSARNSYEFLKSKGLIKLDYSFWENLLASLLSSAFELSEQTLEEFRFEDIVRKVFRRLNLDLQDGDYEGFLEAYFQPVDEQVTLIEGSIDILKHFKEKGYKLGMISNTIFPSDFHKKELERFGLLSYLDSALFSSDVGYKKPHPEIFIQGLNRLKIEPEESVFVGDRLIEDVGGAKNIGMKTILKFKEGRDYTAPIVPDETIRDLSELPEVIRKIN